MEVGKSYTHINPAFFREFGFNLHQLQHTPFEGVWGISPGGVIHKINNAIERTGSPQVVSADFFHNKHKEWQKLRTIAWHERQGGKLFRHTVFVSHAESNLALDANRLREITKILP